MSPRPIWRYARHGFEKFLRTHCRGRGTRLSWGAIDAVPPAPAERYAVPRGIGCPPPSTENSGTGACSNFRPAASGGRRVIRSHPNWNSPGSPTGLRFNPSCAASRARLSFSVESLTVKPLVIPRWRFRASRTPLDLGAQVQLARISTATVLAFAGPSCSRRLQYLNGPVELGSLFCLRRRHESGSPRVGDPCGQKQFLRPSKFSAPLSDAGAEGFSDARNFRLSR